MANELEIMGVFLQSAKIALGGSPPTENVPKYFRWELRDVQQRVPSAFELDHGLLMFPYLLFQSPYGPLVLPDLLVQSSYGIYADLAWPVL